MRKPVFQRPERALFIWGAALGVAIAGALAMHVWFAGYHERLRDASPWTYLKAAEDFEKQNNWIGAVKMLEEAVKRDNTLPLPHERMGRIFYEDRNWAKALAAFREAIARGSRDENVRGRIMWCLIHLKQYDNATEFGKECIKDGYVEPFFPRYTAEALQRAGKQAESIPYWEDALKATPNDLYLLEHLFAAHEAAGNKERAAVIKKQIEAFAEQ